MFPEMRNEHCRLSAGRRFAMLSCQRTNPGQSRRTFAVSGRDTDAGEQRRKSGNDAGGPATKPQVANRSRRLRNNPPPRLRFLRSRCLQADTSRRCRTRRDHIETAYISSRRRDFPIPMSPSTTRTFPAVPLMVSATSLASFAISAARPTNAASRAMPALRRA